MNRSDQPPNAFEAGKAGTAGRDRAEASIEQLRQAGGFFVEAVRATRSLRGKGEDRELIFGWVEKLKGRKLAEPKRNGFGTELLDRIMRYDLDAEPVLEFRPAGLDYRVAIPLSLSGPTD